MFFHIEYNVMILPTINNSFKSNNFGWNNFVLFGIIWKKGGYICKNLHIGTAFDVGFQETCDLFRVWFRHNLFVLFFFVKGTCFSCNFTLSDTDII